MLRNHSCHRIDTVDKIPCTDSHSSSRGRWIRSKTQARLLPLRRALGMVDLIQSVRTAHPDRQPASCGFDQLIKWLPHFWFGVSARPRPSYTDVRALPPPPHSVEGDDVDDNELCSLLPYGTRCSVAVRLPTAREAAREKFWSKDVFSHLQLTQAWPETTLPTRSNRPSSRGA